jgi:hypothetical protein
MLLNALKYCMEFVWQVSLSKVLSISNAGISKDYLGQNQQDLTILSRLRTSKGLDVSAFCSVYV